MPYHLYLIPNDESLKTIYTDAAKKYLEKSYSERDAGFDLYSEYKSFKKDSCEDEKQNMIDQGCIAACWDSDRNMFRAYWMLPRSSISKTPLRLRNSVGLIDAGYRGHLLANVDCNSYNYVVEQNQRLFQIATPELLPWDEIHIVDVIPGGQTLRGTGGFGSTGAGVGHMSYFQ